MSAVLISTCCIHLPCNLQRLVERDRLAISWWREVLNHTFSSSLSWRTAGTIFWKLWRDFLCGDFFLPGNNSPRIPHGKSGGRRTPPSRPTPPHGASPPTPPSSRSASHGLIPRDPSRIIYWIKGTPRAGPHSSMPQRSGIWRRRNASWRRGQMSTKATSTGSHRFTRLWKGQT